MQFSPHVDPREIARVADLERSIDPRTVLSDRRATNVFDRLAAVPNVQPPALLLCGDADMLTPAKYSQFLAAHLPRSRARVIAGHGHMLVFERPDLVDAEVAAFTRELTNEPA